MMSHDFKSNSLPCTQKAHLITGPPITISSENLLKILEKTNALGQKKFNHFWLVCRSPPPTRSPTRSWMCRRSGTSSRAGRSGRPWWEFPKSEKARWCVISCGHCHGEHLLKLERCESSRRPADWGQAVGNESVGRGLRGSQNQNLFCETWKTFTALWIHMLPEDKIFSVSVVGNVGKLMMEFAFSVLKYKC